jgi:hypothetical protein
MPENDGTLLISTTHHIQLKCHSPLLSYGIRAYPASWISCVEPVYLIILVQVIYLIRVFVFFEVVLGCNGFVLSLIDDLSVDRKAPGVILSILRFVGSISSLPKVLIDIGCVRARFIKVQY